MEPKTIIAIVLGTLAVPLIVVFFMKLKKNQDEIAALIKKKFGRKKIVLRDRLAYLVAQQSRGYSQRQGNGNLILTADELFLALTMPMNLISIPMQNIGELERVSRMNGQQVTGPWILKIHYTDDQGQADALGLKLKEAERWETEIRRLQSSHQLQA